MRRALVLLAFASAGSACERSAVSIPASAPRSQPPAISPLDQQRSAPKPAPNATVSGCRAAPSTIYGDEAVIFEIEGQASAVSADVELLDQAGRSIAKGQAAVPGQWRPNALPSGDFRLQAGSNHATCALTVNRELSRGSQTVR